MMVYILMIVVIIAIASFGYILWDLKTELEYLEYYTCEKVSDLENEIENLKEETNGNS